jgi:hypothetical protein
MRAPRVIVPLEINEAQALRHMAEDECRDPRELMRWLLVTEARKRNLLPIAPNNDNLEECHGRIELAHTA